MIYSNKFKVVVNPSASVPHLCMKMHNNTIKTYMTYGLIKTAPNPFCLLSQNLQWVQCSLKIWSLESLLWWEGRRCQSSGLFSEEDIAATSFIKKETYLDPFCWSQLHMQKCFSYKYVRSVLKGGILICGGITNRTKSTMNRAQRMWGWNQPPIFL